MSRSELRRGAGDRGRPCLVAYRGVVYDLSGCPKWRGGLHEGLHFAGQDLTDELAEAPHAAEVFTRPCARRVGLLVD